ncbi:DNA-binding transcriptional regulator, MerR family [Cohnella sp. OV330]|uniref:MerR family transcriptional regulator n=1 Tax=Cohnella sp. OV330 TaxID=1855288 RepID=UPI0008E8A100|nr:MerR family transcriptional regulator [Cohnella sp. OV330]SFB43747.1 DNA-binding transcriptional regulator, MerR family [Cohnella sp. OV330]
MKIGELSRRTGASIRSLRYYEAQGLIAPLRESNGYREYSPMAEDQVRTIRFYLQLGLTTEQIAGFLNCVLSRPETFCTEVLPVYESKLADIEAQIAQLKRIRDNLVDRISSFRGESEQGEGVSTRDERSERYEF